MHAAHHSPAIIGRLLQQHLEVHVSLLVLSSKEPTSHGAGTTFCTMQSTAAAFLEGGSADDHQEVDPTGPGFRALSGPFTFSTSPPHESQPSAIASDIPDRTPWTPWHAGNPSVDLQLQRRRTERQFLLPVGLVCALHPEHLLPKYYLAYYFTPPHCPSARLEPR